MTKNHSRFQKFMISFFSIFKILINALLNNGQSQIRDLLTYLYRQSIFTPRTTIHTITLENYFIKLNSKIKYIIFNSYPPDEVENRSSCTGTDELIQLMSLVQFINPENLLEIGTNRGGTTYNFFLNTSNDCSIYTVDEVIASYTNNDVEKAFESSRIKRITCNTKTVFEYLKDIKFDFIFIDAGHNYDDVKNDTELAFRVISDNGIIVWHDFTSIEPDVVCYLNELSKNKELTHLLNGTLVIYRNQI